MPEVIKCPACGSRGQQDLMGHVSLDREPFKRAPALYRCGECDFLYTVPKLPERETAGNHTG